MLGGHIGLETPVLISNTEVKRSGDSFGTALPCGNNETLPKHPTSSKRLNTITSFSKI